MVEKSKKERGRGLKRKSECLSEGGEIHVDLLHMGPLKRREEVVSVCRSTPFQHTETTSSLLQGVSEARGRIGSTTQCFAVC